MPFSGVGPYRLSNLAGEGAGNWRIDQTGAANSTTIANFGTITTQRWIQFYPGTNRTTQYSTTTPGTTASGVGWNMLLTDSDLAPGDLPGYRIWKAGTWTYHWAFSGSTADTTAAFGFSGRFYVKAGSTYTYQGGFDQSPLQTTLGTAANGDLTFTMASDIIIQTGETLHLELFMRGRGGGTLGTLSQSVTLLLNTSANTNNNTFTPTAPGFTEGFNRTHTTTATHTLAMQRTVTLVASRFALTAVGTANMARRITAAKLFAVTGVGTVMMAKVMTLARGFTVTGTGVVAMSRLASLFRSHATTGAGNVVNATIAVRYRAHAASAVGIVNMARAITAARSFSTTAIGVAAKLTSAVRFRSHSVTGIGAAAGPRGSLLITLIDSRLQTTGTGSAAMTKLPHKSFMLTATHTVAVARLMGKSVAVVAVGVAGFARQITSVRLFSVFGLGTPKLRLDIPEAALDRMEPGGGGTITIIKKPIFIFDD